MGDPLSDALSSVIGGIQSVIDSISKSASGWAGLVQLIGSVPLIVVAKILDSRLLFLLGLLLMSSSIVQIVQTALGGTAFTVGDFSLDLVIIPLVLLVAFLREMGLL